jgi:hypothetical protein
MEFSVSTVHPSRFSKSTSDGQSSFVRPAQSISYGRTPIFSSCPIAEMLAATHTMNANNPECLMLPPIVIIFK